MNSTRDPGSNNNNNNNNNNNSNNNNNNSNNNNTEIVANSVVDGVTRITPSAPGTPSAGAALLANRYKEKGEEKLPPPGQPY